MTHILKKVAGAVLGLIVMITYWEVRACVKGTRNQSAAATSRIPAAVWGGGPVTFAIDVEVSQPGRVMVAVENDKAPGEEHLLEFMQEVPSGKSTISINTPEGTTGSFEVVVDNAVVGATASIVTRRNGAEIARDEQTLTEPLKSGYAFFAQVEIHNDEGAPPDAEQE